MVLTFNARRPPADGSAATTPESFRAVTRMLWNLRRDNPTAYDAVVYAARVWSGDATADGRPPVTAMATFGCRCDPHAIEIARQWWEDATATKRPGKGRPMPPAEANTPLQPLMDGARRLYQTSPAAVEILQAVLNKLLLAMSTR